ncbi:unnamed protein product, partial [Meganyctiphanes norvegica]
AKMIEDEYVSSSKSQSYYEYKSSKQSTFSELSESRYFSRNAPSSSKIEVISYDRNPKKRRNKHNRSKRNLRSREFKKRPRSRTDSDSSNNSSITSRSSSRTRSNSRSRKYRKQRRSRSNSGSSERSLSISRSDGNKNMISQGNSRELRNRSRSRTISGSSVESISTSGSSRSRSLSPLSQKLSQQEGRWKPPKHIDTNASYFDKRQDWCLQGKGFSKESSRESSPKSVAAKSPSADSLYDLSDLPPLPTDSPSPPPEEASQPPLPPPG